jgi:hypothetical protein
MQRPPTPKDGNTWRNAPRPRSVRNIRMERQILEAVERQPTVSTRCLTALTDTVHAFVHQCFSTAGPRPGTKVENHCCTISITLSLYRMMHLQDVNSVNGCCNSQPKTSRLQSRTNVWGQIKILMSFQLTTSRDNFPTTCGLEFVWPLYVTETN